MHGVHAFSFVMAGTVEKGVHIVSIGGDDWKCDRGQWPGTGARLVR